MLTTRDSATHQFASLPSEIIRLIMNKLPLNKVAEFIMLDIFLYETYQLEAYRSFLFNHAISQLYLPGKLHTYFRTRGGRVYACGENYANRLGVGNPGRKLVPEQLASLKDVAQVFCLDDRAFFLNRDGSLYAVGNNQAGQLGVGDLQHKSSPVEVKGLPPIKKVIASKEYTFFLAQNGDVYACGDNSAGMLGVRGLSNVSHSIPHKLTNVSNIEDVAIASDRVYFTSRLGKVFAYGANTDGYLGMGDKVDRDFPEQIQALNHVFVKQVFVNRWRRFFLTDTGQVYVCGSNEGGKLGCGDAAEYISPQLIDGLPPIKKIFMRDYHTFFLTENGDVYVCGKNSAGELGIGDVQECRTPQKLTGLSNIEDIHFGVKNTWFLRADGNVFACGLNLNGELGFLDKNPRTRPELVTSVSQVSRIHANHGSAFFHTRVQKTFVAGKNKSGELGVGSIDESVLLQVNQALKGVTHTYLDVFSAMSLKVDGQVLAAGENRMGELGLPESGTITTTPKLLIFRNVVNEIEKWSLSDLIQLADISADSLREYVVNRAINLLGQLSDIEPIVNILPLLGTGFWLTEQRVEAIFPCYKQILQLSESSAAKEDALLLLTAYTKLSLLLRVPRDAEPYIKTQMEQHNHLLLEYLVNQPNPANQEQPAKRSMRLFQQEQNEVSVIKNLLHKLGDTSLEHLSQVAKVMVGSMGLAGGLKRLRDEDDSSPALSKRPRLAE